MTELTFDEQGLIPVIVQDAETNEVLTLAYMNQESYELTLKDQLMTFYSRSRKELWRKGETSGNYQHLVSLKLDCDQDALVAKVKKMVQRVILVRRAALMNSYTVRLITKQQLMLCTSLSRGARKLPKKAAIRAIYLKKVSKKF